MKSKETISKLFFWIGFFVFQFWIFNYMNGLETSARIVAHFSFAVACLLFYGNPFWESKNINQSRNVNLAQNDPKGDEGK